MVHDYREDVKIDPTFDTYHDKLVPVMIEFESILDGHLVCKSVAKPHIKMTSHKVTPLYCAHYMAWPGTREFEKLEICKMIKNGSH